AQIVIRSETSRETRNATSDAQGRFSIETVAPGRYTLSVSSQGFKPASQSILIEDGRAAAVEVKLEVAGAREELNVAGKGGVAPNSDPNYRALRDASQFETFTVKDLSIKRDAGTLTLTNGTISFLSPVMGRTTMAVFVGAGEFELAPSLPLELDYLRRLTKLEAGKEPFGKAGLSFTD